MSSSSGASHSNDGGLVLVLFLMAVTIAFAIFQNVCLYARSTEGAAKTEGNERRLARLVSGWANIGNGAIHALLVVYMKVNEGNTSSYWVKERKLGGIEGPVGLMIINTAVGLMALRVGGQLRIHAQVAVGCNTLVAILGTLIPEVWLRFLDEGLTTWPPVIIFIWFFIFAMELTAFTTSMNWCVMPQLASKKA